MKLENALLTILICIVALGGGLLIVYMLNLDNACIGIGCQAQRQGYLAQEYQQQIRYNQIQAQAASAMIAQQKAQAYDIVIMDKEAQYNQQAQQQAQQTQQMQQLQGQMDALRRENSNLKAEYDDLYYNQMQNQHYYTHYNSDDNNDEDNEYDLLVIVKNESGSPIEDVHVRIEDGDSDTDYTNKYGEADFEEIEEDCYDITASKSGYLTEEDRICLHDTDERITLYMEDSQ